MCKLQTAWTDKEKTLSLDTFLPIPLRMCQIFILLFDARVLECNLLKLMNKNKLSEWIRNISKIALKTDIFNMSNTIVR